MEYQCVYLNPEFKLAHDDDAPILLETDNLAIACTYIYEDWKINQKDIAIWQPRTQGYRGIYRHKARDDKGRFIRR